MSTINIKPAVEGMQVYDPVRRDYIESTGRTVEYSVYWARRLRDGDVVETDDVGGGPGGGIPIGGDLTAVWSAIAQLQALLVGVNHKPTAADKFASVFDTGPVINVNLLSGAVDVDGDPLVITGVSFQGAQRTIGGSFSTTYGTVTVQSTGNLRYEPNQAAWKLHAGQTAVEVIGYVISDGQGANKASSITITVVGQNNAPVAVADVGRVPYNQVANGNVLSNDYDPDGGTVIVSEFAVFGVGGSTPAGATVNIPSVGSLIVRSTGAWTFTPVTGFSGSVPAITYTLFNGTQTSDGLLNITVSAAAASVFANPVTAAMTGSHATYHVYSDADGDAVPWGALVAGDVVNIHYSSTPYKFKFGSRGQGTESAPIIINGVTDSSGNRPFWDCSSGAFTAHGCNPSGKFGGYQADTDIFSATQAYGESLGICVVKHGPNDDFDTFVPKWLQFRNLDLRGAKNTYTSLSGAVQSWNGAGLWILRSEDCLVENCLLSDCSNGIFTQANNSTISHTSVRLIVRNCRLWGNGVVGSPYEHNFYNQGYGSITEGCYFGPLRSGAGGSAFKSREGAEVIRYCWFEANARAVDMVHSEDNEEGIPTLPDYGTTWFYGNTVISDQGLLNGASANPLHFGGDNMGEQDGSSAVFTPSKPYRNQLYFWNNTVYMRIDSAAAYKAIIFQLSLTTTRCDAWNNIFIVSGTTVFSWVGQAGVLNLRGTNMVYGTLANAVDTANAANYQINKIGTIIAGDPLVLDMAGRDFHLSYSSAAIDAGGGAPEGLPMANIDSMFPLEYQPRKASNGYVARVQGGTGPDLGSTEYGVGYTPPPPPAPDNLSLPYITGNRIVGGLLTAHPGAWLGRPGFVYEFRDVDDTALGVGQSFSTSAPQVHTYVHVRVTGSNITGSDYADSAAVFILSTNAPVCTAVPTFSGAALMEGNTVTLNAGTWTNSPDSYTYEVLIDGTVDADLTVNTSSTSVAITLPEGTGGHAIVGRVSAHRTAFPLDTNDAQTTGATVAIPPADPDAGGKYNFTSPNGTTIGALNGGVWQSGGSSSNIRYECINGALQCVAGTGSNGELVYLTAGQGANQSVEGKVLAGWAGSFTLMVQQTGTQSGYSLVVSAGSWQARRGGIYQDGGSHSASTSADLTVKLTLVGGVFTAYINGTQVFQMTDGSPLTGGGLAFILGPGADVTQMRLDYIDTSP